MKYSLLLLVSENKVKRDFTAPGNETGPQVDLINTGPTKLDGIATDTGPQTEYTFNAYTSFVAKL